MDSSTYVELIRVIEPIGRRIAELKSAARRTGIPTIYVNDNYHKWKSDFRHVVAEVLEKNKPGNECSLSIFSLSIRLQVKFSPSCWHRRKTIVRETKLSTSNGENVDHFKDFVLKPKHSGFYCTPLEILLDHLQAEKLILAGFAGNICVLFTANDAYMRNYDLIVPRDCIGSNTPGVRATSLSRLFLIDRLF